VLIMRRSKLYYTASGIVTRVGSRPVHRFREDFSQPVDAFNKLIRKQDFVHQVG